MEVLQWVQKINFTFSHLLKFPKTDLIDLLVSLSFCGSNISKSINNRKLQFETKTVFNFTFTVVSVTKCIQECWKMQTYPFNVLYLFLLIAVSILRVEWEAMYSSPSLFELVPSLSTDLSYLNFFYHWGLPF